MIIATRTYFIALIAFLEMLCLYVSRTIPVYNICIPQSTAFKGSASHLCAVTTRKISIFRKWCDFLENIHTAQKQYAYSAEVFRKSAERTCPCTTLSGTPSPHGFYKSYGLAVPLIVNYTTLGFRAFVQLQPIIPLNLHVHVCIHQN